MGFSLAAPQARPLITRYAGGEEGTRRYYQDAAVRAVLEKLARGEKRALLSLATGAGKTFIAVNLLRRIGDAGQLRRALFVCDRDELRSQGLGAFQNVFGADAAAGVEHQRQHRPKRVWYYDLSGVKVGKKNAAHARALRGVLQSLFPEPHRQRAELDGGERKAIDGEELRSQGGQPEREERRGCYAHAGGIAGFDRGQGQGGDGDDCCAPRSHLQGRVGVRADAV